MTGYIRIPIRGKSKQRPRMGKNGVYMNRAYQEWKKDFRTLYGIFYPHRKGLFDKSIQVKILFQFKIPKSYTKKQRENPDNTKIIQDIDNLAGGVLDALNGTAYKDDRQITSLSAEKLYGVEDCIYLGIKEC